MKQHWFIWIPRGLIILVSALFLLMSMDSFEGQDSIWNKLLGFLIHNIPFIIMVLIIWLTWNRPLIAGVLFVAISIGFTIYFHIIRPGSFQYVFVPHFATGVLFIIAHFLARAGTTHEQRSG